MDKCCHCGAPVDYECNGATRCPACGERPWPTLAEIYQVYSPEAEARREPFVISTAWIGFAIWDQKCMSIPLLDG